MKTITHGLLVLLLTIPVTSHALTAGPVDGQVLDYDSGQPIEGAIIVGLWKGNLFQIVESKSVCVHAESTVSDANGRYHIDGWAGPSFALGVYLETSAYKAGYQRVGAPLQYQKQLDREGKSDGTWIVYKRGHPYDVLQSFADEENARAATHPNDLYLKPFSGTSAQRFEYVRVVVFASAGCFEGGTSQRNLYRLAKAAFQEAKPLATTSDQKKSLRFMRGAAIDTWLALPGTTTGMEAEAAASKIPEEIRRDLQ